MYGSAGGVRHGRRSALTPPRSALTLPRAQDAAHRLPYDHTGHPYSRTQAPSLSRTHSLTLTHSTLPTLSGLWWLIWRLKITFQVHARWLEAVFAGLLPVAAPVGDPCRRYR
eukprot:3284339-Rhodomonas_salina.1